MNPSDVAQYADEAVLISVLVWIVWGFATGRIVSRKTLDSILEMAERLIKEKL